MQRHHISLYISLNKRHRLASEGLVNFTIDHTGRELRSTSTTHQDATTTLWPPTCIAINSHSHTPLMDASVTLLLKFCPIRGDSTTR